MADDTTKTLGYYERLFMRGHDIELTNTVRDDQDPDVDIGEVTTRIVTKDPDLALAYELLIEMRSALIMCLHQFRYYGAQHAEQLDRAHLTLVERQELESKRDRDNGIADQIALVISDQPIRPASQWRPIKTAPQNGAWIRLLGKYDTGAPYIESGRWANIKWSVELPGHLPPTHWMPMEHLPAGYLDAHA